MFLRRVKYAIGRGFRQVCNHWDFLQHWVPLNVTATSEVRKGSMSMIGLMSASRQNVLY